MATISSYEQQANKLARKLGIKLTVLDHYYGSMGWDKKGEQRRIFNLELKRGKSSYNFKFGQSINNSCDVVEKPQAEVADKIEVFAGLSKNHCYASVKFTLLKSNDFNLEDEELLRITNEMEEEYYNSVSSNNVKWRKKFEDGIISKNEMFKNLEDNIENGTFYHCIQKAIEREKSKLVDTYEESSKVINPTMYDVLTCLTKYDPGTFEDFCSEFGYDEDSRSAERTYQAVVEEWKNVERLFTEEELEELREIN